MEEFFGDENPLINLITIASAIAVGILVHFLLFKFLKSIFSGKDRDMIKDILTRLQTPALILFIFLSLIIAIPLLSGITGYASATLKHILSITIIACIAWVAINAVKAGRFIILHRHDVKEKNNLHARKLYTQTRILERVLIFIIAVISVGIILMTFEPIKEVGVSLLTSAGIAGIILGFAAQKLIATVVAGIQIAITQPIRIDDVVIVENEWGRIEEIRLTYVVVKIWDERRMIVPTTYFIEKPFQNWTRTSAELLGSVFIYTDYEIPFDVLRGELTRLLESHPLWDKRVNVLQVTDIKTSIIEIRCLMSAADSGQAFDLRVFVREKMIEFLRENYPESLPRTRVQMEGSVNSKQLSVDSRQ